MTLMAILWMILGSWIWLNGNGSTLYQENKTSHKQCNQIVDSHFHICLIMEVIMAAMMVMNPRWSRIQTNPITLQPKQSAYHWVLLASLHALVLQCFCSYATERMYVHPIHDGYHDLPLPKKRQHHQQPPTLIHPIPPTMSKCFTTT